MKILVPHDGSVTSDRALRKAIIFAKKLNYEILLLHVIDLKTLQLDTILKQTDRYEELTKTKIKLLKFLKSGSNSILRKRMEWAKKEGVKAQFSIAVGPVSEVILKTASTEKVDFILMGSSGYPPLKGDKHQRLRILGSIARKVSELSDRPIMIVK